MVAAAVALIVNAAAAVVSVTGSSPANVIVPAVPVAPPTFTTGDTA